MKVQLLIVILLGLSLGNTGGRAGATNISGKWTCVVEVMGPPADLKFVFKQEGEKLSGTYSGPLGEHEVTGTVKGNKVEFSYDATYQGRSRLKATYTGTIESSTRMAGAVEYTGGARGKWTATKQKK